MNNGTHPAKAGTYITLFGTGQGVVRGMPPDGDPTPAAPLLPARPLRSRFSSIPILCLKTISILRARAWICRRWQINVKIPANVPPGDVPVFVDLEGINSVLDPNGIAPHHHYPRNAIRSGRRPRRRDEFLSLRPPPLCYRLWCCR